MIDKISGKVAYAVTWFSVFLGMGEDYFHSMASAEIRYWPGRVPHQPHGGTAQGRAEVQPLE